MDAPDNRRIRFGEFEVDPNRRELLKQGEPIALSSRAFDLLLTFVTNPGRTLTKNELLDEVWKDQFVEENNLSVQMHALRKALDDRKRSPRFLVTVPGQGYKFVGDIAYADNTALVIEKRETMRIVVEEDDDLEDSEDPNDIVIDAHKPSKLAAAKVTAGPRRRWRMLVPVALVAAFFAVATFALFRFGPFGSSTADTVFAAAKQKQLTTKGAVAWAAVSPDGKFYAYALNERGEYKQSLWLGQTDGGQDIQLRPPVGNYQGMAFSPDGKTLYFTVSNGEPAHNGLFRMSILGGVVERLFENIRTSFAISPDGSRLAFARSSKQAGWSAVVTVGIDGSDEKEITVRPDDQGFFYRPAWSPDGRRIAIVATSEANKESPEVFVVRVADGHTEQLTSSDWVQVQNLAWLKDGAGMIAVAISRGEAQRHLWQINYPGGEMSRISTDTDTYGAALNISANGDALVAVQLKKEGNLWIGPADDVESAKQVTFSSMNGIYGWYGFDWIGDERLVFSGGVDRTSSIFTMNADGSNIRQITSEGFYDHLPTVTPDGQHVLFQSNRSGVTEIWRVRVDGSDLRQMTTSGGNAGPQPTPDGQWIVYLCSEIGGRNSIRRMPINGGEPVVLMKNTHASEPAVSPDGKLVVASHLGKSKSTELVVMSIDDGSIVRSFTVPDSINLNQSLVWKPDGSAICYRDWGNGVWCQAITGGDPVRLEGVPQEKIYKFGWSDSGKLFAIARGREISDAVLLTPNE